MKLPVLTLSVMVGLALVSSGCQETRNARLAVGDRPLSLGLDEAAALQAASGPSVTGLDRSGWAMDVVRVERDGVEHWPVRTRLWPSGASNSKAARRDAGLYPTAASAVDPGSSGMWGEAFAGPASVLLDAVMWVPRAVDRFPGSRVTSPMDGDGWERWPEAEGATGE